MSKSIYVRAYANQDVNKVLEVASIIQKKLGLKAKDFYFPSQCNENGYFSVLIRVPQDVSELEMRAKISWATGNI